MADIDDVGNEVARDASGGWHDAGDSAKNSVGAAQTSTLLPLSWERGPRGLTCLIAGQGASELSASTVLPTLPLVLDEARWGLRWLLKMQDADGRVRHEVSRRNEFRLRSRGAGESVMRSSAWGARFCCAGRRFRR